MISLRHTDVPLDRGDLANGPRSHCFGSPGFHAAAHSSPTPRGEGPEVEIGRCGNSLLQGTSPHVSPSQRRRKSARPPFVSLAHMRVGTRPNVAFVSLALAAAILTLAAGTSAVAENAVVKRFSNGTTQNSVGIVDASEDAPQDGPQAIYAADDGSLYLLDQVNGRVLRFDARTADAPVQSLELPENMRPTDIVVRRGSVYVWDGAPQALAPTGRDDAPVRRPGRSAREPAGRRPKHRRCRAERRCRSGACFLAIRGIERGH